MTFIFAGVLLQFATFAVAAVSYLVAMVRFHQATDEAGIAPVGYFLRRQVEDPLGTLASAPYVTAKRVVLPFFKSPDQTAEAWRRIMLRRAFLAVCLLWGGFALPITGWLLDQVAGLVVRSGSGLAYVMLAMDLAFTASVLGAIGYLAIAYANGYRVRRSAASTWVLALGVTWVVLWSQIGGDLRGAPG